MQHTEAHENNTLQKRFEAQYLYSHSSDIITRTVRIGEKTGQLYLIDGLCSDAVLERVIEAVQTAPVHLGTAQMLLERAVSYAECSLSLDAQEIFLQISTGAATLFYDGCAILIKARNVPTRGIAEPQNDRVLRGARTGFVETLVKNTALLRRQIKSPELCVHTLCVGQSTKTQVAVCYMGKRANPDTVKAVKLRLAKSRTDSATLGAQSIAEILIQKSWWNPFPKFRFTERPDAASAAILEGCVVILTDNSPQAILLPVSILDFLQQTEDYYMPPAVGTYLRLVRFFTYLIGIYLTPIWYFFDTHAQLVPHSLSFLVEHEQPAIPLLLQFLIIEFAIDGLRLASLNTPDPLANSLSVVGGLILGDIAVQVGWVLPQTVLYAAIVAIANFIQQSFELGYATKFSRIAMLCATAAFGIFGLLGVNVLLLVLLLTNKTVDGTRRYFWPLIPFNGRALLHLLIRRRKFD